MINYDLLEYHKTFSQNNGIVFILKSRIQDWYKEYGGRINTLNEKIIVIQERYFVTDGFNDKGQLKIKQEQEQIEQTIEERILYFWKRKIKKVVPGKMKYMLKEGMMLDDYQKEMNTLLMQDIVPIHTGSNGLKIVKR